VRDGGINNMITREVEAIMPNSKEVETLHLLKWTTTPAITSGMVSSI
jgi:hypothetical protein